MRSHRTLLLLAALSCSAQTFPSLTPLKVVDGVEAPTMVTSARDGSGRVYVVEQPGRIRILRDGTLLDRPFLDIGSRVLYGGERGLLSVVFPPGYADKHYFYVNYTGQPNGDTVIARYRTTGDPEVADPASEANPPHHYPAVRQSQRRHDGIQPARRIPLHRDGRRRQRRRSARTGRKIRSRCSARSCASIRNRRV